MDNCSLCNIEINKNESLCLVCLYKLINDKKKREWNWPFPQNRRYNN